MQILAQHGFGNGDKIERGLSEGIIDGAIFGAKDIAPNKLTETLNSIAGKYPTSTRLFDPQFYASMIASKPGARLGYLLGDTSYPYFESRRRRDLDNEAQVLNDLRGVLQFQSQLPLTAWIAPNIVIQRSFDSIEASISKDFLRNAAKVRDEIDPVKPLYATLAVSSTALNDRVELQNFLQEITELETPPEGFYLLLEKPDTTISATLTEPDILSRWMLFNYVLKLNGFKVINGYADVLAPYLGAAGAEAIGAGWYNTLKTFSFTKFEPTSSFARKPVPRYTSLSLLKSIRHNELHDLRDQFPVLNGLSCDSYYDPNNGSMPELTEEALQNWQCLRAMGELVVEGDVTKSLDLCRSALDKAEALYVSVGAYGLTMRDRSSNAHIELLREEISEFSELAEL
jgi:hypothetical protein